MKLDLVMRKFASFDCERGAMFTCCVNTASKYAGRSLSRNVTLQPNICLKCESPLKIAELARSLCHGWANCWIWSHHCCLCYWFYLEFL